MEFNLIESGKEKSDLSVVLTLIKYTNDNVLQWHKDLDDLNLTKFTSFLTIDKTNKKIKIEFIYNKKIKNFTRLEFYLMTKNQKTILKMITGIISNPLYYIINKKYETN